MGMLSKYSVKGYFNKSGEGELLMGQDSSVAYEGSGKYQTQINPWEFSSDPAKAAQVEPYAGQYVYIHYRQYMMNNPFTRDTDYELLDISPKANIVYKQSFFFNPVNQNTGYDIVRIEPLPSLD